MVVQRRAPWAAALLLYLLSAATARFALGETTGSDGYHVRGSVLDLLKQTRRKLDESTPDPNGTPPLNGTSGGNAGTGPPNPPATDEPVGSLLDLMLDAVDANNLTQPPLPPTGPPENTTVPLIINDTMPPQELPPDELEKLKTKRRKDDEDVMNITKVPVNLNETRGPNESDNLTTADRDGPQPNRAPQDNELFKNSMPPQMMNATDLLKSGNCKIKKNGTADFQFMVMVDLELAFHNGSRNDAYICQQSQDAMMEVAIQAALQSSFPSKVPDWPGKVDFTKFGFDDSKAIFEGEQGEPLGSDFGGTGLPANGTGPTNAIGPPEQGTGALGNSTTGNGTGTPSNEVGSGKMNRPGGRILRGRQLEGWLCPRRPESLQKCESSVCRYGCILVKTPIKCGPESPVWDEWQHLGEVIKVMLPALNLGCLGDLGQLKVKVLVEPPEEFIKGLEGEDLASLKANMEQKDVGVSGNVVVNEAGHAENNTMFPRNVTGVADRRPNVTLPLNDTQPPFPENSTLLPRNVTAEAPDRLSSVTLPLNSTQPPSAENSTLYAAAGLADGRPNASLPLNGTDPPMAVARQAPPNAGNTTSPDEENATRGFNTYTPEATEKMLHVRSKVLFTFVTTVEAPTDDEINDLLVMTEAFFTRVFSTNGRFRSDFVSFTTDPAKSSFDNSTGQLELNFLSHVELKASSTATPAEAAEAMGYSDLSTYVREYVWSDRVNQFYHTHVVDWVARAAGETSGV